MECDLVSKKQKTCEAKVDRNLEELINLVQAAKAKLCSDLTTSPESVLDDLRHQIKDKKPIQNAVACTKELHSTVGKLGKAIEMGQQDVCKALMKDVYIMDEAPLNQVGMHA